MITLNTFIHYIALVLIGIGIGTSLKYGYDNLSKSLQKKKAMERARFVKDIRTEVRKYLEELKS